MHVYGRLQIERMPAAPTGTLLLLKECSLPTLLLLLGAPHARVGTPWLSSELLSLFHVLHAPPLTVADHAAMISPLPASGPPDEVAAVRSQLLSLFAMLGKAGAAGGALPPAAAELSLTTRGLLRCADHAGQGLAAAEEVSAAAPLPRGATSARPPSPCKGQ